MVRGIIHKLSTMDFPSVDKPATSGYNTRMTNHYDQLKLVRTRMREITNGKFVFQTVWSFSPDGINPETYVVSAVVSIDDESNCNDPSMVCETFVFPGRDENGDDFSGFECWSSPHFMGHHDDHKILLGDYLRKCAQEQRDHTRETSEKLEDSFPTT